MSIKKSQAILKCFIDLKYSDWFTLGSEDETNFFVTLGTFFSSTAGQGFLKHYMTGSSIFSVNFTN